jgi:hypothetical protein
MHNRNFNDASIAFSSFTQSLLMFYAFGYSSILESE